MAAGKLGAAVGCGLAGWVEGERMEMVVEKSRSGAGYGLWPRPGWVIAEHAALVLLLPPSSQFHFHDL